MAEPRPSVRAPGFHPDPRHPQVCRHLAPARAGTALPGQVQMQPPWGPSPTPAHEESRCLPLAVLGQPQSLTCRMGTRHRKFPPRGGACSRLLCTWHPGSGGSSPAPWPCPVEAGLSRGPRPCGSVGCRNPTARDTWETGPERPSGQLDGMGPSSTWEEGIACLSYPSENRWPGGCRQQCPVTWLTAPAPLSSRASPWPCRAPPAPGRLTYRPRSPAWSSRPAFPCSLSAA